jgi:hypothetical protein
MGVCIVCTCQPMEDMGQTLSERPLNRTQFVSEMGERVGDALSLSFFIFPLFSIFLFEYTKRNCSLSTRVLPKACAK